MEAYRFSTPAAVGVKSLTLLTAPFGGRLVPLPGLSLEVSGAYASGLLVEPDGSEFRLSGLTDTNLRATLVFLQDRVVLSAGYTAPTGEATQTLEQAKVAGAIAADLLSFRISNWGSGGGFNVNGALITRLVGFGIGLELGYGLSREFEPLSDDERAYLPGNPLRTRFAIDHTVGAAGKLSLQLSMQRFSNDELGGQNLYRSGDRYQGMLSYAFAAGSRASMVLYSGWMRREHGTFLQTGVFGSAEETPAQDLLLAGSALRLPVGRTVLSPSVDARVFRSADGQGQGYAVGAGLGAEIHAHHLILLPALRARFGNVMATESTESTFTGLEAAATLRWSR